MVPKFLKSGLTDPIDSNGKPRKYISFLIPLFKNDKVRKIDMLNAAGIILDGKEAKGYFSSIFNLLTKARVLNFDTHLRVWERGENWSEYIGWVITELCKVNILDNKRINRMFRTFDENSTNFIMDLDEEQSENE